MNIFNGTKTTEYRDYKYWKKRIDGKHYTHIKFQRLFKKSTNNVSGSIG